MENNDDFNTEKSLALREVHKAWGPAEAEVIKSFLESQGIICLLKGRVVQSIHPFTTDGLGEIRILVTEKDYDEAKSLLENKDWE